MRRWRVTIVPSPPARRSRAPDQHHLARWRVTFMMLGVATLVFLLTAVIPSQDANEFAFRRRARRGRA